MSEHEGEWSPNTVTAPEYPPPEQPKGPRARDMERADAPTAWQRAQAQRKAEREASRKGAPGAEEGEREEGEPLSETKKAELLRCAEAFEHTAAKLREIVGA